MMQFKCDRCGETKGKMYSVNNVYEIGVGNPLDFFNESHLCDVCLGKLMQWMKGNNLKRGDLK